MDWWKYPLYMVGLIGPKGDPSFTRLLVLFFSLALVFSLGHFHPDIWTVALVLILLAAAFGKSTLEHISDRFSFGLSARTDTSDTTTHTITERRDPVNGIEPAE